MSNTAPGLLREVSNRFIDNCPDADNKIDPVDKKRVAAVKKILNGREVRLFVA
jgi:hypothetical protein